jgi:hypothetical protein
VASFREHRAFGERSKARPCRSQTKTSDAGSIFIPVSTHPLPSVPPSDPVAFTRNLNPMPSIKSQSSRRAEAGFVFAILKNYPAAHKNTADAPPASVCWWLIFVHCRLLPQLLTTMYDVFHRKYLSG